MRLAPECVERLALLDTGTHTVAAGEAGEKERAGRMALLALARSRGMRALGEQWARGMVHPDRLDTPVFESILDMLERSNPEQFAAQITALLNRPDAAPLLPAIQCPTLVLCGADDAWSPPPQHQAMHAAMTSSRLCLVDRCGHMSTMERPAEVSAAMADWLARD